MKSQKLLLTLFSFTVILLLVSVGFNVYFYQQIKGQSEKNTSVEIAERNISGDSEPAHEITGQQDKTKEAAIATTEEESGINEVKELEYHLNAAEEEVDIANEKLSEELDKKEEFMKLSSQLSKSYYSDPARKKSLRESTTRWMSRDYDPLLKKMNISKEKFEEFIDLLVEDSMRDTDEDMETFASFKDLSQEEMMEAGMKMAEAQQQKENRIKEFLGDENYGIYQSYNKSLTERRNLREFMETQPPDSRLTEEQEDHLIDAMYEARRAVNEENLPDWDLTAMQKDPMELVKHSLEVKKSTNKKYLEASRGFLSSEQVEQYKAHLQQKIEEEESMLKMGSYFLQ